MADTKISALTATVTLADTDIVPVVTDPGGTPANKKITKANLAAVIYATTCTTDINISTASKGLVVTTPDGAHTYRITVDNSGVLSTEQIT